MKRTLAVCFAAILLLSSCASSQSSDIEKETAAQTETETVTTEDTGLKPDIPELDYNGAEFRIYHNDYGNNNYDVIADGITGEPLNDIVYQRNIDTEEKFNIHFNTYVEPGDIYGKSVMNSITAGDDAYELVITTGLSLMNLISMNLTYDLTSSMPYMDLSKPWWSKDFQENTNINGKLFAAAGDITHIGLESIQFIAFNRDLFYANDLETPYNDVRNGTWTYDKFNSLTKDYTRDLNGDGKLTLADDQYGYIIHENIMTAGYMFTNGAHICTYRDGLPCLDLEVDKLSDVCDAYKETVKNNVMMDDSKYGKEGINVFLTDRALFTDANMRAVRHYFRDMKSDFGLVPLPKFDESIPRYTVFAGCEANIYAVPVTTEKTEMISAVLEYMAYYGYTNIIPIYYDVILGDKLMRDQDSRDMMGILRDSMYYDFGNWSGLPSLLSVGLYLIRDKKDVASYLAANQSKMEKELASLMESVSAAEG